MISVCFKGGGTLGFRPHIFLGASLVILSSILLFIPSPPELPLLSAHFRRLMPTKVNFFGWQVLHERVNTMDRVHGILPLWCSRNGVSFVCSDKELA